MIQPVVEFDVIIAGGGLAGRSLAYFLSREADSAGLRILIVDDAASYQHRSIIYRHTGELPLSLTPAATYRKLAVDTEAGQRVLPLERHTLCLTSSRRIFATLDEVLDANPRITRLNAHIALIRTEEDKVVVTLSDGRRFDAAYCFDSTSPPPGVHAPLLMSGEIRRVRTSHETFDPSVATLIDFRNGDHEPVHFHCVLPLSTREAFVEVTRITQGQDPTSDWSFEKATQEYLRSIWEVADFSTVAVQRGTIPLGLPRQTSRGRHLYIGTASGAVKATTGYGFTRILQQSEHIASSLATAEVPTVPRPPLRFGWYDKPVLNMWKHHPESAVQFMQAAFRSHDADLILDFLDEGTTPLQERGLLGSMPVRMLLDPRLWL